MDASILNSLALGLLGLVLFFYLLHTTIRSGPQATLPMTHDQSVKHPL